VERPLDSWWCPTAGVTRLGVWCKWRGLSTAGGAPLLVLPGWACGVSGAASRQLVVPHCWCYPAGRVDTRASPGGPPREGEAGHRVSSSGNNHRAQQWQLLMQASTYVSQRKLTVQERALQARSSPLFRFTGCGAPINDYKPARTNRTQTPGAREARTSMSDATSGASFPSTMTSVRLVTRATLSGCHSELYWNMSDFAAADLPLPALIPKQLGLKKPAGNFAFNFNKPLGKISPVLEPVAHALQVLAQLVDLLVADGFQDVRELLQALRGDAEGELGVVQPPLELLRGLGAKGKGRPHRTHASDYVTCI
jgi:hypothetical protein